MTLTATGLGLTLTGSGGRPFEVLNIPTLTAEPGALTVLTGPSGSGKSTLLFALSGLQTLDRGTIRWGETEITALPEPARDRWRRGAVGLVFQSFHLIDELSPLDNVLVPVWFGAFFAGPSRARAASLLEELGVPGDRPRLRALSRGEQQRVALARALMFDPPIILADEPTASLDRAAGARVIDGFRKLARDGRLVLAVSHDPDLIAAADHVLVLDHGQLVQGAPA